MMRPGGRPIKRNQVLVANALGDKEAALLLFNDNAGRRRRDELVRANDHVAHPRGELMYHIELVALLSDACASHEGVDNPAATVQACAPAALPPGHHLCPHAPVAPSLAQVREMMPLAELLHHLLHPSVPLPPELHSNYLALLCDAYLDSARRCKELDDSEELAALVCDLVAQVVAFSEDVLPTLSFDSDEAEEELKQASFVFGSALPALALFYTSYYVRGALPDDPSQRLVSHLAELLANATAQQHLLPPEPVRRLMHALASHGFADAAADAVVGGSSLAGVGAVAAPEHEEHPQEHIEEFFESFYAAEAGAVELSGLVDVFATGLRKVVKQVQDIAAMRARGVVDDSVVPSRVGIEKTQSLVKQLLAVSAPEEDDDTVQPRPTPLVPRDPQPSSSHTLPSSRPGPPTPRRLSEEEEQGTSCHSPYRPPSRPLSLTQLAPRQINANEEQNELTVSLLHVLAELLNADDVSPAERRERQLLCNQLGASVLVLKFGACEDGALCQAGLQLGVALLVGGNREVQDTMLGLLKADGPAIAAADGTAGSFLASMKRRLRLAVKEVRDRKVFLAQQKERREHFDEVTEGMSARAKAMVHEDIERSFASRANLVDVCELLRLMAEGHHLEMQDYLRVQQHALTTHDLVSEVTPL